MIENNVRTAVRTITRWLRGKPRRPYAGPFAKGCWGVTEALPDDRDRSLREALSMAYQLGYAAGVDEERRQATPSVKSWDGTI